MYLPSSNPPTTIAVSRPNASPRRFSMASRSAGPAQNSRAQVAAKRRVRATTLRAMNSTRSSWVTPLVRVISL